MTTVVTGAAGGIGAAVVEQVLARGERVIAQDLAAPAARAGVTPVGGDLLAADTLDALLAAMRADPPARLVAAHGMDGSGALRDIDDGFVRRVLAVNAVSVARLYDAFARLDEPRPRAFVVVASQAGLVGEAGNAAYCASKFAVVGWLRALAPHAAAADGVHLRALCPGCTDTPLLRSALERFAQASGTPVGEFTAARKQGIAVGRFAAVEETAAAALYLANPAAGAPVTLAVTGGEVLF
jgi:NAD(P)-dependent dehydrogenase (short-subunit alcohol dehydrogenase family)